jgi:PAT family beta-lactamase induction signal transducer AmpG
MQATQYRLEIWKKFILIFFLGFSSGLPFLLIGGTLKLWMARENVDIKTIGFFGWVSMAYSLKFLWAPLVDRFTLFRTGRRKSWILVTQFGIMGLLYSFSFFHPAEHLWTMAILATCIGVLSATQDLAIDALRREMLSDEELGLGSTFGQYGYRVAMLVSGGIGISFVNTTHLNWNQLYIVMALLMGIGVLAAVLVPEPKSHFHRDLSIAHTFVSPLREFFSRPGAWLILAFIFFFKFGDAISGAMLNPFYAHMQYSNEAIGLIAKTFGLASSLVGLFIGGVIIYRFGILKSLFVFGVLQGLSTAAFALPLFTGPENWALAVVVIFEDVSAGMGSAAFVAYIASLTDTKYTATQFAVLSSVATLGRNFFSGFSGVLVESIGWFGFFMSCAGMALPGLLLLAYISQKLGSEHLSNNSKSSELAPSRGTE